MESYPNSFEYQLKLFDAEQFEIYSDDSFPFSPDGVVDFTVYPKFFWWRFQQVFGDFDGFLAITLDLMDEYFKEPKDKTQTRCPRCFSIRVSINYPYIECLNCNYNEPLIDFSISRYYHLALEDKSRCRHLTLQ